MEAAAIFPILLIAYLGVIEITQYLNAKDRVNRLLNQTTDLFVTSQTTSDITAAWNSVIALRRVISAPNDIALGVRFCSATSGAGAQYTPTASATYGQCGSVGGSSGVNITTIPCPTVMDPCLPASDCYRPGLSEMIRVRASCRYRPIINWLNLFRDGIIIDSGYVDVPLPRTS